MRRQQIIIFQRLKNRGGVSNSPSVGGERLRCTGLADDAAAGNAADYKREGQGEALHIACAVIAAIVRFSMKVRNSHTSVAYKKNLKSRMIFEADSFVCGRLT